LHHLQIIIRNAVRDNTDVSMRIFVETYYFDVLTPSCHQISDNCSKGIEWMPYQHRHRFDCLAADFKRCCGASYHHTGLLLLLLGRITEH
jgi:hypothetical protein